MSKLKAAVVRPSELTDHEINLWRSYLASKPGIAPAFMSHAYALAAQQCFMGVRVAKLELSGKTVGFFPFQFRSRLHRLMRIGQRVSGDLADYFGVVGSPDLRLTGAELLQAIGINSLLFDHLDETQLSFGLVGTQTEPGLRIAFPEGGAAYWDFMRSHDKKFVQDTERRERKLVEAHGALRFVFRHESPATELENLISAKRQQYDRTGALDVLARATTRNFLKILSGVDDPHCRSTLSTLHAGDKWICSHFGLTSADTLHFWFPVYNPEMKAFAPGRLLIKAIIDSAHESGVKLIDRGAGDSQAKRDFATSEHLYYRGVWQRRGVVSLAYRAGLSTKWRMHNWQKRRRPAAAAGRFS